VRRTIGVLLLGLIALGLAAGVRLDLPPPDVDARYAKPWSKFVTQGDGTRLHYWDLGDPGAPVVVLLHGAFDSAVTWEAWAPRLARDFRVLAPDLPAHGLTGWTPTDDYGMARQAETVRALLDHLGIARAHVAGNSMGGNVAWRLALAHPERVDRLVLADAGGYPEMGSVVPPPANPVLRFLYRWGNPAPMVRANTRRAVADPALVTDTLVERFVTMLRRDRTRDAQERRLQQRASERQPVDRLHEIAAPTLILWGDQDRLLPVAFAARFDADIPDSRAIVYPGIGHLPQLEAPERSLEDVRRFLRPGA
jgi:pimeloyl-ACP methyl ester carboxylesterase